MDNGVKVLHTAPMKGVHDTMLVCNGMELGFRFLFVVQFKYVLGSLGELDCHL